MNCATSLSSSIFYKQNGIQPTPEAEAHRLPVTKDFESETPREKQSESLHGRVAG